MFALLKATAANWIAHKDSRLGAALAYYSIFSLGPIIVVAIAVAGLVFGEDAVRGEVSRSIQQMLGPSGAQAVETMLNGVRRPAESVPLALIGLGTLIFAAIGVVVQLKDAFNTVWEVDAKKTSGIWGFIRSYVFSVAAVIALGFLLLVSLVLTAALSAIGQFWPGTEALLQPVSSAISFAGVAFMFAAMFKYLPDTNVSWRAVWPGALLAAALFEVGKFLIGFYVGKQGLETTFGAAASLVVVLIWVYYSAQIVLLGAEFTRVYSGKHGR